MSRSRRYVGASWMWWYQDGSSRFARAPRCRRRGTRARRRSIARGARARPPSAGSRSRGSPARPAPDRRASGGAESRPRPERVPRVAASRQIDARPSSASSANTPEAETAVAVRDRQPGLGRLEHRVGERGEAWARVDLEKRLPGALRVDRGDQVAVGFVPQEHVLLVGRGARDRGSRTTTCSRAAPRATIAGEGRWPASPGAAAPGAASSRPARGTAASSAARATSRPVPIPRPVPGATDLRPAGFGTSGPPDARTVL